MSITPVLKPLYKFTETSATPLTTVFTPPPDCTVPFPAYGILFDLPSTCEPFGHWTIARSKQWYSPGVCPYKYEYIATSVQRDGEGPPITLAVCCPRYLNTWRGTKGYNCWHKVTPPDWNGPLGPFLSAAASASASSSSLPWAFQTLWGNPVSIAWQQSDLSRFTPASAPVRDLEALGVLMTTSEAGPTAGPTSPHGSGLSTGAKAGIAVGAIVIAAILLAALWCMLTRYQIKFALTRRDTETREIRYEGGTKNISASKQGMETAELPESKVLSSHEAARLPEAPYTDWPYEVDARAPRAELEGDFRRS